MSMKKEYKLAARYELLRACGLAFVRLEDAGLPDDEKENMRKVLSNEMARIEKLFGIEPYSTYRGC